MSFVELIRGNPTVKTDSEEPRIESGAALHVAGLRDRFTYETIRDVPALWQRFAPHVGHVPGRLGNETFGVIFDDDGDGFSYLAGVAVANLDAVPPELAGLSIPAHTYAVFSHEGHVSALRRTLNAIWSSWLPASAFAPVDAPAFERYDERFDPLTGNGTIEVWVPIVPRARESSCS